MGETFMNDQNIKFKATDRSWNYDILLFDADRTLLDFDKSELVALQKVFEEYGIEFNEELVCKYTKINHHLWDQHELGLISRERLIYKRFEDLFVQENLKIDSVEFEDRYQFLLSEQAFLIDGALELIKDISKYYGVYIVTNGVKDTQMKRLVSTGIAKYVKDIFISDEIGYQKPSKEYFNIVSSRIYNFDKRRTIIIGDSLTSDIKGGNNAGVDTCWYNPLKLTQNVDVFVTFEIDSLETLREKLLDGNTI